MLRLLLGKQWTFAESLLCTRHCSKYFTCINSLNSLFTHIHTYTIHQETEEGKNYNLLFMWVSTCIQNTLVCKVHKAWAPSQCTSAPPGFTSRPHGNALGRVSPTSLSTAEGELLVLAGPWELMTHVIVCGESERRRRIVRYKKSKNMCYRNRIFFASNWNPPYPENFRTMTKSQVTS